MWSIRANFAVILFLLLSPLVHAHGGAEPKKADRDVPSERFIQTQPGHTAPGVPAVAPADAPLLSITVIDKATGDPAMCRVNVIGPNGNYYEPVNNPLGPWSLQRLGNRIGKGPFRYYGWFFYSQGTAQVRVPAGEVTVEVWKGFEYRPIRTTIKMPKKERKKIKLKLERSLDMAERDWISGDTHIHLNRQDKEEEARALDLIEAEDIRYGFLLAMNDTKTYTGTMDKQEWRQNFGMGRASIVEKNGYALSSGQEYRCRTYGHICLLMGDALVFNGDFLNPNDWPLFKDVAHETHRLNGVAIHAHGGYEQEIYADFVDGTTDGVELLQFAVYRGIGLEGWYHMLNAGYRFPAVGGSDFPYCRALGDCRTYAYLPREQSMENWTQAVAEGRTFFTTGPMLELSVEGAGPGETIGTDGNRDTLEVSIQVSSEVAPLEAVDIIVNGEVIKTVHLNHHTLPIHHTLTTTIPYTESMWVSARAHGEQVEGFPDAEAHTNPVYIIREGKPIRHSESVQWLLNKLDERITYHTARDFEQKEQVLAYFQACREQLASRLP